MFNIYLSKRKGEVTKHASLHNPVFFDLELESDQERLNVLINQQNPFVFDTIESQLLELFENRITDEKTNNFELFKNSIINDKGLNKYGNWVYFPWSNHLVHCLPAIDFIELRTSRNKYKINEIEQEVLSTKNIGIIGLSVGRSVAQAIGLERGFKRLNLADFDNLDLSNLNRINSSIAEIGLNKTVLAKRDLIELDPYLEVNIFKEGLTKDNIYDFITDCDIIVDEFDNFHLKVYLRKICRELGIPVISEMSDRCMVDIERFDLSKKIGIYHGRVSESDLENLNEFDQHTLIEKIISFETISERMKLSYEQIGKSIKTWPQLGSDVMHGGGICAQLVRKILLGEDIKSGRYYFETKL